MSNRPFSGKVGLGGSKLTRITKKKKQSGVLRQEQKSLLMDTGKDREQEIIDGIEKFQNMLSRYPLKPKKQKSSNSLANKNLNRVYGKIQRQFTEQVLRQES